MNNHDVAEKAPQEQRLTPGAYRTLSTPRDPPPRSQKITMLRIIAIGLWGIALFWAMMLVILLLAGCGPVTPRGRWWLRDWSKGVAVALTVPFDPAPPPPPAPPSTIVP